jgi:hypothetical protein
MDLTVLEYTVKFIIWYLHCTQKRQNKPEYGQLYIFYSVEATKKQLENELNRGCSEIVMLQLDEMLQRTNPFAESCTQMHEIAETNRNVEVKWYSWKTLN